MAVILAGKAQSSRAGPTSGSASLDHPHQPPQLPDRRPHVAPLVHSLQRAVSVSSVNNPHDDAAWTGTTFGQQCNFGADAGFIIRAVADENRHAPAGIDPPLRGGVVCL